MGREIKRVQMDFDWPIGKIWPGYMHGVCSEAIEYCMGGERLEHDMACEICRHAAKLAGRPILSYGCPQWKIDPLPGEGWQMWETETEGSPMSPVFKTPEGLAQWLVDNRASASGYQTATYDEWFAMIKKGWAPSMVLDTKNKTLQSGVSFMAKEKK